ncbi:AAA family ATPase [Bradyrhizobium sp. CCGE-LA001]|uniref:AAA family ATPase n=1 Tax=Bradyrhizobium sp. CCGE-LA001 TaxID=1223566 RepID=UPI0002AAB2C5|nr:ATP-binding protein [Bradyrhizobium sp. CCGE-LA001]
MNQPVLMNQPAVKVFDAELVLPNEPLTKREKTLLGFDDRYQRVHSQLRLLLNLGELGAWNKKHFGGKLAICDFVAEQYPLVIFHGDVGTGKTATAECLANRLIAESRTEDSILFKLSNRVRGSGKVGEMGSLLSEAFARVVQSAGKGRRAILIIDEGDSIAAARSQAHSHHEDKVAVNTLIQGVDDLRRFGGRVVVFLCTNRMAVVDPALQRRAAIVEEFKRPTAEERRQLLKMDLGAMNLSEAQIGQLVTAMDARGGQPPWTFSDIRTRLYPAALALAYPDKPLQFEHLRSVVSTMKPSPAVLDQ